MEISSLSGMQMGMTSSGMRSSSSVDTEEFAEQMSSKFLSENDVDGDGQVSADEFDLDSDLFDSIDEDGDGFLTQEELLLDAKARMTEMQANFSSQEMNGDAPPPPPPGGEGPSGVMEQQGSGSGETTSDSSGDSTDDAIDTNGDGVISHEELMAYLQSTMSSTVAESASATQATGAGAQLLEQLNIQPGISSGSLGRAADAYSMQQSMFGESQNASYYAYGQTYQEGMHLSV